MCQRLRELARFRVTLGEQENRTADRVGAIRVPRNQRERLRWSAFEPVPSPDRKLQPHGAAFRHHGGDAYREVEITVDVAVTPGVDLRVLGRVEVIAESACISGIPCGPPVPQGRQAVEVVVQLFLGLGGLVEEGPPRGPIFPPVELEQLRQQRGERFPSWAPS